VFSGVSVIADDGLLPAGLQSRLSQIQIAVSSLDVRLEEVCQLFFFLRLLTCIQSRQRLERAEELRSRYDQDIDYIVHHVEQERAYLITPPQAANLEEAKVIICSLT